jgi:mannonate dehydratase
MKRREFLSSAAAAGGASLGTPRAGAAPSAPKGALKLAMKHVLPGDELKALAAFGIRHVMANMPSKVMDESWSVEGLTKFRERFEAHGIRVDMIALPLSAVSIDRSENPNIMLGKSPERDREIDNICQMIRNCARAGIPAAKYNLTLLGVLRTESTPGRGGAMYSTFDYSKLKEDPPLTPAGRVTAEESWERIRYYVERVLPVAEEYKVKLACHPHDPALEPGKPFRGVNRVLDTADGLRRFVELSPSPYHGLLFCQGTVSESLARPGEEIYDVIRWFGSRKRIFAVDFRNITGTRLNFRETFPDDGEVDMLRALQVYRDVGYDGMLFPDHVPRIEGDQRSRQAFAFAIGYIGALINMVNEGRV